jgi:hypothetical protein
LVINVHGALIELATEISKGQQLEVQCSTSPDKQTCRAVRQGESAEGKTQWGIEFIEPVPHFWHITFPPADWSPSP